MAQFAVVITTLVGITLESQPTRKEMLKDVVWHILSPIRKDDFLICEKCSTVQAQQIAKRKACALYRNRSSIRDAFAPEGISSESAENLALP
ncbi:hypothetical protein BDZ45DRAFT_677843 [Acephala macrosclerotiorum]|nr:hypothetical protein BDZ45DRAFT_677843 [Acephala macrosclerotiorum]